MMIPFQPQYLAHTVHGLYEQKINAKAYEEKRSHFHMMIPFQPLCLGRTAHIFFEHKSNAKLWHTLDSDDCKRSELGQRAINCVRFLHISRVNHMGNEIKTSLYYVTLTWNSLLWYPFNLCASRTLHTAFMNRKLMPKLTERREAIFMQAQKRLGL